MLRKVEHNNSVDKDSEISVSITLENKGVAPFYYDWPLALYLISSNGEVEMEENLAVDIKTWLPGSHTFAESVEIPAEINSGTYDVKLAILDPDTGDPGVMFANTNRDDEGRYLVSKLTIN